MKQSIIALKLALICICILNARLVPAKSCSQSIPTVTIVDACPESKEEWIKAKERKQCYQITQNCTSPDKFTYHCLPNRFLDRFVEVCAPVQNIVGQHCSFYDMDTNSVRANFHQSCREYVIPCPVVYYSNSIFKYRECCKIIQRKNATQTNERVSCSKTLSDHSYSEQTYHAVAKILIIVVVLLVGVAVYFVFIKGVLCKEKSASTTSDNHQELTKMFVTTNDDKRTCKHATKIVH